MTQQMCSTGCGRPSERMLCEHCLWEVKQVMDELPALLNQLALTLSRQGVVGKNSGSSKKGTKGKTQPLPYNVHASEMLDDLRVYLVGWVRDIAETYEQELPPNTLRAMSRWMLARLDIIAVHSAADDIHHELTSVALYPHGKAWRAVDRPPEKVFIGKCGATVEPAGDGLARGGVGHWVCEEDVMAHPKAPVARCLACGAEHSTEERREKILKELDDRLYTAAEIADLVVYLGGEVSRGRDQTRKLINQWHKRGRIERHQDSHVGEPMFRFGTVMIELAKEQTRRERVALSEAS